MKRLCYVDSQLIYRDDIEMDNTNIPSSKGVKETSNSSLLLSP